MTREDMIRMLEGHGWNAEWELSTTEQIREWLNDMLEAEKGR